MKKGLIALALLLTLGMSVPTLAQKHRHTPRGTELVDTTRNSRNWWIQPEIPRL